MSEIGNRKSRRRSLGTAALRQLRELVERDGLQTVATTLGIHPQTVATMACGIAANLSTASHVERRLTELNTELSCATSDVAGPVSCPNSVSSGERDSAAEQRTETKEEDNK